MNLEIMQKIGEDFEVADDNKAVELMQELKHHYLLGMVAFVCSRFKQHKPLCTEGGKCDFLEGMAEWVDHETFQLRVEVHSNVFINLAITNDQELWPIDDESIKEQMNELIPQIKARLAQGDKMGILVSEKKPSKDKQH